MKDLVVGHVFGECSKCAFLRLITDDQLACSLGQDKMGTGSHLLLNLKRTHKNVDIDDPKCPGCSGIITLAALVNEIAAKARHFSRGLIGFSTGCLYQSEMPLVDKLKAYLRAGSTALELSFATPAVLAAFLLNEAEMSKLRKFSKITIHAPWKEISYFDGSGTTNAVISKIVQLRELLPISGVVFHPDVVANFSGLEVIPLPVLIENMDRNKKFGISVEDIYKIRRDYDFGFVFDIQHAYEHDPAMVLAHELVSVMGDRIRHLHVSGQSKEGHHVPVYQADNKKEICQILKIVPGVPAIMEGLILTDVFASTKREIAYVIEQGDLLK